MKFSHDQLLRTEDNLVKALRASIAFVFIWFGLLKVFGYNPVFEIIGGTFPMLADGSGFLLLGIFETVIGLALLWNRFHLWVHIILVVHLLGTFLVFLGDPGLMFDPFFPVLSLEGEFVVKNVVLAIAGLVVLVHERRRTSERVTTHTT